jgi:hypothetical protein
MRREITRNANLAPMRATLAPMRATLAHSCAIENVTNFMYAKEKKKR